MKCPCKKCISFAICNSIIKDMKVPDVSRLSLDKDCYALKDFLGMDLSDRRLIKEDISTARKIFGLKDLTNL